MTKLIGLDAGHGLYTNGKQTPDGIKEWTLNDKVCDKIALLLNKYDCKIIRTDHNEGTIDETLSSRIKEYINAGVDAFISIHHNAFTSKWNTATGVEVYTDNKPISADIKLAKIIYDNLVKYTGLRGRGIKKANFYVINQNKIPAVLVEGGFMDSTIDYKIITSEEGQNAYAKAVAEGLIEFLELKEKPTIIENSKPIESKIDVKYQVYDNKKKKWLPNVLNNDDYAGIFGHTIGGIYANLSKGNIFYKVHIKADKLHKARWLPEVKNRLDYAGIFGKEIDAITMFTDTGKKIKYAVHLKKDKKWLPYVSKSNINDSANGYAGIFGKEIDAIKIYIE